MRTIPATFAGLSLPTPTSLLRDRSGRVVLPPVHALDGNRGAYYFSDADLHAILVETRRLRRWWWLGSIARVGVIAGLLYWFLG